MKSKSIKVAFVAAIAFVSGITVFNSQKSELELSDVALANVEALADGENWGCSTCGTCTGTHYICESAYDSWWDAANRNCSSLNVSLVLISGC